MPGALLRLGRICVCHLWFKLVWKFPEAMSHGLQRYNQIENLEPRDGTEQKLPHEQLY